MNFLSDREWKSYFPQYHFPHWLRLSCTCLGLLIVGSGIVIFFVIPGIIAYVVTLDEFPLIEIGRGATVQVGDYGLTFVRVGQDTRCPGVTVRSPTGTVFLVFSTSVSSDDYVIEYVENTAFSDSVALPQGYLLRVVRVSPESSMSDTNYVVELQIVKPPTP
jgi:hypothetical protein